MQAIKYCFYTLVSLCFIGFIYQTTSSYLDQQRFQPPGQFTTVNGVSYHYQYRGQGSYTLVFEAGMGDPAVVWDKVIELLPENSKTFTYDRAGLGWSSESFEARTSTNIVRELKGLLDKTAVDGKLILVGHSMGGLSMQLFAQQYPDKVAGLILVDSAHEAQTERLAPANSLQRNILRAGMWAAPIGLPRLYLSLSNPVEQALKSTTKHQYTSLGEARAFTQSQQQIEFEENPLGDLPITVISRNKPYAEMQDQQMSQRIKQWALLQAELSQLSTRSLHIHSGQKQHAIHKQQPQLVAKAIQDMLQVLNQQSQPE